jgi:hypothetical protein
VRLRAGLALIIAILLQALAVQADLPGPPGPPSPAPVSTPGPTAPPSDWTVNRTAIGLVIDQLDDKMFGVFTKFTTRAVELAQTLFLSLAGIELGWTLLRWFSSPTPLDEYTANSLYKIVQQSLLFTVISNSYSSPFGPGWFFMIVNGIVGMAQDTAGFNVVGLSSTGQFTPAITPGTILDIGLRLFTLIMTAASTGTNAWDVVAGMTSGATMMYFGRWCFCLLSACAVVAAMAWIAFRWLWVTLAALWHGTMVFLTGFTGSRVTASIGYGPFNAAFAIGIEMAAHVVIIGLFYPIVTAYVANVGFAQALQNGALGGGVGPVNTGPGGAIVVQIGAVLLLDLGVALWAYAIARAPDLAAGAISGSIRLGERDALDGVRGESMIGQTGAAFARVGAGGVAGLVGGGAGGDGEQPSVQDRLKGAFAGAVRGGLMAGPEGAVGGAAVGAVTARGAAAHGQTAGSVRGGAGASAGSSPGEDGRAKGFTGGFVDRRGPGGQAGSSASERNVGGGPRVEGTQGDNTATGTAEAPVGESAGAPTAASPATSVIEAAVGVASSGGEAVQRPGSVGGGATRPATAPSGPAGARVREAAGPDGSSPGAASHGPSLGNEGAGVRPGAGAPLGGTRRAAEQDNVDAGVAGSAPRTADAVVEALTRALHENTAALRGQQAGTQADAGGGQGDRGASTPLGGIASGAGPQSAVNMMLYRQLLNAGRRQKQDYRNERPAVSLGVSHIE